MSRSQDSGLAARLVLALAVAGLTGCAETQLGKQIQDATAFIEISRDIANAAQPCLVDMFDEAEEFCQGDEECEVKVRKEREQMADWYDRANELLCRLMPALHGCKPASEVH